MDTAAWLRVSIGRVTAEQREARATAPTINVAAVVDLTDAEGPGERFAVWVQGCPMRCPGCCNPDLLVFRERELVSADDLAARALRSGAEGVSILGGEPFAQAAALAPFAGACRVGGMSVMVYSGYTLEELRSDPAAAELLRHTDVLVDGRYDASAGPSPTRWVGSANQRVHFLTGRYSAADPRFREQNSLEIRVAEDGSISVNGWPFAGAATGLRVTGRGT